MVLSVLASAVLLLFGMGGPGYGGTADAVDVAWVEAPANRDAPPPVPSTPEAPDRTDERTPQMTADQGELRVQALGFRARSEVSVEVGGQQIVSRADSNGSVDVTVYAKPKLIEGSTVFVSGRAPSGSQRSLVGSVPLPPSGASPRLMAVVLLGLLGAAVLLINARSSRSSSRELSP